MSEPENLGPDRASEIMAREEPVDLPEGLAPPADSDRPGDDHAVDGWAPDDMPPAPPVTGDGDPGWTGEDGPPVSPPEADPAAVAECAGYDLNDYGNGRRFVRHFGRDLRFVSRMGWHVWDGTRWKVDEEIAKDVAPRVRSLAQKIGPLIALEAAHIVPTPRERDLLEKEAALLRREADLERTPDDARPDDWADRIASVRGQLRALEAQLKGLRTKVGRRLTHAKNAGNSGPLSNMAGEARVMLALSHELMDAAPLDVNTETGVLRFQRIWDQDRWRARVDLVDHDRDQLITKMAPVAYDPDAECPRFHAYLNRIQPDLAMRRFLARWLGLSMTALTWEQRLAFFYGSGANGKSVLTDLLARILGDYAATAKIESLTGQSRRGGGDATPDLIPLVGARFVRASEPDEGQRLQEGLIKELTGGEKILVRALHADFIEVQPLFKLTISGNHKPDIRATDDGIWRRVMLVPFDVQIPKAERDAGLGEKLWAERSGILNWLIGGLLDYLENGLQEPASVLDATAEYRDESDPVGQFLSDCTVITAAPTDSVQATELRDAFVFWQMGQATTVWTDATIAKRLAEKARRYRGPGGVTFEAGKAHGGTKVYRGIRLSEDFARAVRNAPRDTQGRFIRVRTPEDDT